MSWGTSPETIYTSLSDLQGHLAGEPLPRGAVVRARGSNMGPSEIVSLRWPVEGGTFRAYSEHAWGRGLPAEHVQETYYRAFGGKKLWTVGSACRRLWKDWTALEPDKRRPEWENPNREIRSWMRRTRLGGAMRVRHTYAKDAVLLDMRGAYLQALESFPVGVPTWNRSKWATLRALAGLGYAGWVEARVKPLRADVTVLPWRAPKSYWLSYPSHEIVGAWSLLELEQAERLGFIEILNVVRSALWGPSQSSELADRLRAMKEPWLEQGGLEGYWKALYRAFWPCADTGAGWKGELDGELVTGCHVDRHQHRLVWSYQDPDAHPSGELERPDVPGEVCARVRAEIMKWWGTLPAQDVHACFVDCLVCSREAAARIQAESSWKWAIKDEGLWLCGGIGRYILGTKAAWSGTRLSEWDVADFAKAAKKYATEHSDRIDLEIPLRIGDWSGVWPVATIRETCVERERRW